MRFGNRIRTHLFLGEVLFLVADLGRGRRVGAGVVLFVEVDVKEAEDESEVIQT